MSNHGLGDHARSVIDANRYMALGTAGEAGHPWVSPVWFAAEDYRNFYWVSSPDSKHSRNIATRPEVALAVFDSSVPVGGAQAVYMKGQATELTGDALERGLAVFDRVSRKDIGREWVLDDVRGSALFRLYCATVSEHWVLIPGRDPDRGSGVDRSEQIQSIEDRQEDHERKEGHAEDRETHRDRQGVEGIHRRGAGRDEGARPRVESRSAQGGRRKHAACEGRRDEGIR